MAEPKTIPNGIKFLFGGLSGMGATLFVQVTKLKVDEENFMRLRRSLSRCLLQTCVFSASGPGEDKNASGKVKWSLKAKHI